jgi:3-deoxy-7-phosphoheptulonate synthase
MEGEYIFIKLFNFRTKSVPSFAINKGLKMGRSLLLEIAKLGLPAGCEFLDTISPQYISDLVAWGAIGARTTESQVHRELTSGLSMPIGFKNSTDGGVDIAVQACIAARNKHCFLGVTEQGLSGIVETEGNEDVHIILRGGTNGPNYEAQYVKAAAEKVKKAGLRPRVMVSIYHQSAVCVTEIIYQIDCSHGNSSKQHARQIIVADNIVSK